MRWKRGVLAVVCATAFLLVPAAWAGEVHVYTDREIRPALLEFLNGAERSLDVEMYALTDAEVIAAMERAQDRGVQVRLILDPNQAGNETHVDALKRHGVDVKWFPVKKPAQMHRKLAIVDGAKLFAGSVNWTANGLGRNEELMMLVTDPDLAKRLEGTFSDDWYRSWLGHDQEHRPWHRRR